MTTARTIPARFDDSASGWERALYAFLAEKERRSGSRRTVESLLTDAAGLLRPPRQVTRRGHEPGRLRLRPRHRPLRAGALGSDRRCTRRLRLVLLPLPDPHGRRGIKPLRRPRAAKGEPGSAARAERRAAPEAAGGDPRDARRP